MSDGAARLFVAVDLPDGVRSALAEWGRGAAGDGRTLRALPSASLHVTLCFIGNRPQDECGRLWGVIEPVLAALEAAPIGLAVDGPAWLPPRSPRVLAATLRDRGGRLAALARGIESALAADAEHVAERRAFRPHVTVARVRRGVERRDLQAPDEPPSRDFAPAAVTLYRSRAGRYEALARQPVAAWPD